MAIKDNFGNPDKVIYSKFSGTEVKYEGTDYLIIKYTDLLAVL